MQKFLINRAKLIHILYGVLMFIILISAVIYMTEYANLHVIYTTNGGNISIGPSSTSSAGFRGNAEVYNLFSNNPDLVGKYGLNSDFNQYKMQIYNYQMDLNAFNDLIVVFGVVGIVCFALIMFFGNQSRRVYYISNLVSGVVLPSIVAIFGIVMLIKNTALLSNFNDNYYLYNLVALAEDPKNINIGLTSNLTNEIIEGMFQCSSTTFIIYNLLFIVIILVSLAMVGYAVYRFFESSNERKQILAKAGTVQC